MFQKFLVEILRRFDALFFSCNLSRILNPNTFNVILWYSKKCYHGFASHYDKVEDLEPVATSLKGGTGKRSSKYWEGDGALQDNNG